MPSDNQIKQQLTDRLAGDRRYDLTKIDVEVDQGAVKLTGDVTELSAHKCSLSHAKNQPGVVSVDDQVQIIPPKPDNRISDQELEKRAADMLTYDSTLSQSDVTVECRRGKLVLSGQVDALWKKEYASEVVRNMKGVCGIENKLTVNPDQEADNSHLAAEIDRIISRMGMAEAVNAQVRDGTVTLSGVLPSIRQSLDLINAVINDAYGLTAVQDKIQIQPEID